MESQSNPQLELFSENTEAGSLRGRDSNPFFKRIWAYERVILIIFAMLVTGIIAFSLGVEKGKENINPVPAAAQVVARKEVAVKQAIPVMQQQGSFVIQVGTFKDKANALKEAEILKKSGLNPLFFNKGSYIILCVGNFPNKETAQKWLSELNKRYGNCQIRRL